MAIYQAVTGTTMVNVNNIAAVSVSGNQVVLSTIDGKTIPLAFPNATSALNAYATLQANLNTVIPLGPAILWTFPSSGVHGGGSFFTVGGYNFQSPSTVTIGGVSCQLGVLSSGGMSCSGPAVAIGTYDVVYNGPNGIAILSGGWVAT